MTSVNASFNVAVRYTTKNFLNRKYKNPRLHFLRDLRRLRYRVYSDELSKNQHFKQLYQNEKSESVYQDSPISETDIAKELKSVAIKSKLTSSSQEDATTEKPEIPPKKIVEIPTAANQFELLTAKVTPYYKFPYEAQVKKKYLKSLDAMKAFGLKLMKHKVKMALQTNTLPCVLDDIIPSPVTESYRNKDEFSIRTGVDGDPKTVGFFLDSPSESLHTICVNPDELPVIKSSHKQLAHLFQSYIRASSLPACHNFCEGGYWRNLIVRSNKKGDIMGIVIMHPQQLTQDQLQVEMNNLKEKLILPNVQKLQLKSFYFQACAHTRCTHQQAPFQLLFGEPHLVEEMNGVKYKISPESFFQTNTLAAEVLYKVIFRGCRATKRTTILDICCGIGPVSFTFAPHVKRCIGIDSSLQAIEDAKANAEMNGIKNVEFYAGRLEHLLQNIFNDIYADELIAVLNPARSTLGYGVMKILRECKHLKKILFVTCKPEAFLDNLVLLCEGTNEKKGYVGAPFYPMRAVAVDQFPHTKHYELLILFQRI